MSETTKKWFGCGLNVWVFILYDVPLCGITNEVTKLQRTYKNVGLRVFCTEKDTFDICFLFRSELLLLLLPQPVVLLLLMGGIK